MSFWDLPELPGVQYSQGVATKLQRSPISWAGGKALICREIIAKFPKHHGYVFDEIDLVLGSPEEFGRLLSATTATDIQRASRWYLLNKNSFGGKGRHFGTGKVSGGASLASRSNRIVALASLNQRLDGVCIEHLDWRELLKIYDSPANLFFLDPPYVAGDQGFYSQRWTEADHRELAQRLGELKGAWVLTYCDSPLVRELYGAYETQEISTPIGVSGKTSRDLRQLMICRGRRD